MRTYKLSTWKLEVKGEYATEEEAIKDLSDRYMRCSKCDPPGKHFLEMFNKNAVRTLSDIGKRVFFYVEEEIYGHKQLVLKYDLDIHPFKKEHWWKCVNGEPFSFEETEFRYVINTPIEQA
jgi:hypothetical protein